MTMFSYSAKVPHTPGKIDIDGHFVMGMWQPHKKWCVENIGYKGERWEYDHGGIFYFVDEQDVSLFLLRWS